MSKESARKKFIPPKFSSIKGDNGELHIWEKGTHNSRQRSSSASGSRAEAAKTYNKSYSTSINESSDCRSDEKAVSKVTLLSVIEAMKSKFMININAIDKLYSEKKMMEKRIQSLEEQVNRISHGATESQNLSREIQPEDDERLTPDQIADMLDSPSARPQIDPSYDDASFSKSGSQSSRPSSAAHARSNSLSKTTPARPSSAGKFIISPSLQADLDRYNQRMEMVRIKELEKEKLKREYELIQKQKLLRASTNSNPEIQRMLDRQAAFRAASASKREALQKKLKDEKDRDERERRRVRQEQLSKPIVKHDVEWKDFAAIEEAKRKQRIEQRKQELLLSVSDTALFDSGRLSRSASRERKTAVQDSKPVNFHATEDPEKIAEKLRRRQEAWEAKLSRTKEQIRQSLADKHSESVANALTLVKTMQQRQAFFDKKRSDRLTEKARKEEEEKEKKLQDERKKREKLFSASIPETGRRLTNAAELRAVKVREALEEELKMQARQKSAVEKKRAAERETGAVVKEIIAQREFERKQKVPGFVELSAVNDIASSKAAEKRKDLREKMRQQRRALEQVKKSQPSLIERYEQQQAKKTGQHEALQKVAAATGGKEADDTDFFSDKEKLLLQL